MDSIRTSSLFHFTSKLDNLKTILIEGIKPNYCKEDFAITGTDLKVGIPMTSFCDIPLTRITNFTKRYNEYAIGLSKEWGFKNNINPILYASNEEISRSFHKIKSIPNLLNSNTNNSIPNQISSFSARTSVTYLFGFTKKYEIQRNGKVQCNYEENEWRYIVPESLNNGNIAKWYWTESEYKNWRGSFKVKPKSIFPALEFDINDVNFIILKDESQIPRMIDYIEKINVLGGRGNFDDISKKRLISKIISIDRIKKDF